MTKDGNTHAAFTKGAFFKDHDVVLNTLDRENKGMFLPLAAFEGNVGDWNGTVVIEAIDHPDMDQFNENQELALGKVKGRIVGKVKDAHIDMTGHPTLNSTLAIEDDAGLERQIAQGTLSLSTAFWHGGLKTDDSIPFPVVQGPVQPHHVLIFSEDPTINAVPGDKGSIILNKETTQEVATTADEKTEEEGLFARFKAFMLKEKETAVTLQEEEPPAAAKVEIAGEAAPAPVPAAVPATAEAAVEAAEEAVKEAIAAESFDPAAGMSLAEALATIVALKAEIEKLKTDAAGSEAEMKWESFKANVPPGMIHGDKEAELRTLYEGDPDRAWRLVMKIKTDPEVGGQEGEQFTAGDGEPESPKIGAYNPTTKAYEDAQTL